MSGASAAIGCVDGSWSCWYAHAFSTDAKVVHASAYSPIAVCAVAADQVAKDSLSHRSSHHCMVTRSPNHMCAISCRMVSLRRSRRYGVGSEVNTYSSR